MSWQEGYFGIGKESTFGVSAAVQAVFPFWRSVLGEGVAPIVIQPVGAYSSFSRPGTRMGRLSVEFPPDIDKFYHVLTGLLGTATTSGLIQSNNFYQYVFEPKTSAPTYTVVLAGGSRVVRATGTRFSELQVSIMPDQLVRATLGGFCREVYPSTSTAPGQSSYTVVSFGGAPFGGETVVQVDGTPETRIINAGISYRASVTPMMAQTFTGLTGQYVVGGPPTVDATFSIQNPTSAWLSYVRNHTPLNVDIRLYAQKSYYLSFQFPQSYVLLNDFNVAMNQEPTLPCRIMPVGASDAFQKVKITARARIYPPPPP